MSYRPTEPILMKFNHPSLIDWQSGCECRLRRTDGPKLTASVRVNGVATSDRSAVEGSTVSLDCSTAVANPPVISETTWWSRDGAVVQDGRRPLIMRQLDRTHAGRYTCSATNTLAPSGELPRNVTGTATVQLQVMCKSYYRRQYFSYYNFFVVVQWLTHMYTKI